MTFGALGDSFYEYLLKVWLQGGRQESEYRRMYDEAMDGVAEILVKKVHKDNNNNIGKRTHRQAGKYCEKPNEIRVHKLP